MMEEAKYPSLDAATARIGIPTVRIPRGSFLMGSQDDNPMAWDDEKPQHRLEIPYDFWIGKHPVTSAGFAEFVGSTSHRTRAEREGWCWVWRVDGGEWGKVEGGNWKQPQGPASGAEGLQDHPVVQVCFYDVLAYCEWLNHRLAGHLPPGYEVRLPSEAEWEKAARGLQGREWPWGDEFDASLCNSRDSMARGTIGIGRHSPRADSAFGVSGMSGNAWEWTLTLWGRDRNRAEFVYPYNTGDGRESLEAGEDHYRIIRGGSYKDDYKGVRCACRDLDPPHYSLSNLGFRVVVGPLTEGI
jgi:formylglycine-generating enzyme required for sulfatase activity